MNRHLAMSGQVVNVPMDDLLALTVAFQSLGKPSGPATQEDKFKAPFTSLTSPENLN